VNPSSASPGARNAPLTARGFGRNLWAMGSSGWWNVGRLRGIPIRVHWSAILGALFFSGFRFAPGGWLGFVIVILIHELGHAAVVKITRQHVHGVTIHGMGGECQWSGNATPIQRSCIAWGGVWGQLALFAVTLPLVGLMRTTMGTMGGELAYALTWGSLVLAALNLIPFGPLDGVEAWKLPGLLVQRYKRKRARAKTEASRSPKPSRGKEEVSPEIRSLMEKIAKDARDARRGTN
jgi:stage IV sporulation protein FB